MKRLRHKTKYVTFQIGSKLSKIKRNDKGIALHFFTFWPILVNFQHFDLRMFSVQIPASDYEYVIRFVISPS